MQRHLGLVALLGLVTLAAACTPRQQDQPAPPSGSGASLASEGPCKDIPQQPAHSGQRLIRGFLDVRNFPKPGANGEGNLDPRLGTRIECVLSATDGWASPNFRFDLNGGPDNEVLHVVLLTKEHLHNKDLGGCENRQDDSCAQIRAGQPENQCSIVIRFESGWDPVDRAGVFYHELGHCFLGPQHSSNRDDLMFRELLGERIKTARPSAQQKAVAEQRVEQAGPIFKGP